MKIYEMRCKDCNETWILYENEYSEYKSYCPFCNGSDIKVESIIDDASEL